MISDLITLRAAVPKDATAVAAIHDAAWRSTYQGIIPHLHLERMIARRGPLWWQKQIQRGAMVTLISFDGLPQGYATSGHARGSWPWPAGEIFELYVTPTYQGLGLGRTLFQATRRQLKRDGYARLVVWALAENEPACAFYEGLGGTVATTAPERFGETALTRVAYVWGINVASRER